MSEKIRKICLSIIYLSLSLIFGYIEAIFPITLFSIGIKIGLCNIITIIGLKTIGVKSTLIINILRLLILGVLFSNVIRFLLSISGFVLSFLIMTLALVKIKFSIIVSSILGGVFHNIGQIIMLSIIMKNVLLFRLIPIYMFVGILTGLFIGVITNITYNNLIINIIDNK